MALEIFFDDAWCLPQTAADILPDAPFLALPLSLSIPLPLPLPPPHSNIPLSSLPPRVHAYTHRLLTVPEGDEGGSSCSCVWSQPAVEGAAPLCRLLVNMWPHTNVTVLLNVYYCT